MKKENGMEYEQDFKCWYSQVCQSSTDGCQGSCIRYSEMMYLMRNSGIPRTRWIPSILDAGVDIDQFERLADIKDDILRFVSDGENLFITSANTGNGKTSWSIKLLLKYFDQVWAGNGFKIRGMFVHVPTLLLQLKNFSNPLSEDYKQHLMNCDVVVWDEIGYSSASNYDYTNMLIFLEHRLMNGKCNIYTTNCNTKAKLEEQLGSKLASRIWSTSEVIEFKGRDKR